MGIAVVDAIALRRRNRLLHQELVERYERLAALDAEERTAQEAVRRQVYDEALVPFKDAFARLKHVDLAELADLGEHAAAGLPSGTRPRPLGLEAADAWSALTAVAGSAVASAGASAATYAAVGAFATASTGTAISGLSGAAASSATLAWLGGGSLAAGGGGVAAGTAVLAGIFAAPVVLTAVGLLEWRFRRVRRVQRESAVELASAAAECTAAEADSAAVRERGGQVRLLIDGLGAELRHRLPRLRALIDRGTDYAAYTPEQRAEVAVLVALAGTIAHVMAVPLADDEGRVTDTSARVVAEATARLTTLTSAT